MPWHIPDDLKRFKALTMGHAIVMGRKTFEAIGRLLPGRRTIVITRDPGLHIEGATVVRSFEDALAAAGDTDEVFVVGGGEIYALALPRADRLQLTELAQSAEGDAHFPVLDRAEWQETLRETHCSVDGLAFDFVVLDRQRHDRPPPGTTR